MKRLLASLLLLLCLPAWADVGPIAVVDQASTTITVGVASAATALPRADTERRQIELQNAGTVPVFVRFCSSSTCTATVAASYPILAGQSKVVTVPTDSTHIGHISGSASQTLYVSIGIGN